MAEEDSAAEKTEEASPRRLEKAREEGQIPRSRDFTTSAVLIVSGVGLWIFGSHLLASVVTIFEVNFSISREVIFDPNAMIAHLAASFWKGFLGVVPVFSVILVAAIVGPILLGGFLFSGKSIEPKLERMDPIAGLKRMFSTKALVELVKSFAKVFVVVGATYFVFNIFKERFFYLGVQSVESGMSEAMDLLLMSFLIIGSSTFLIAAVDVPYQIWEYAKKMRMSRQDLKDEMKDSEGKPEVKGRIRQLQREIANRQMMSNVPKADVIITNPTHFSIALRYDPDTMATPILIAKGVDQVAMKIREIAREHKIEQIRSPVLARAIYYTTKVDGEIPQGLYMAVAQVLAYVFQLRNYRKGRGERPDYPTNIKVPRDLIFPEKT